MELDVFQMLSVVQKLEFYVYYPLQKNISLSTLGGESADISFVTNIY